jgi:UDP-N-acetylglucosamine 4,6-dehydratase
MVPRDDARMTLEFDDHYVIEPNFQFWDRESYAEGNGGVSVPEEFKYGSDSNPWRLTQDELQGLIADGD